MSKKRSQEIKNKGGKVGRRRSSLAWVISLVLGASVVFAFVFFFPRGEPWGLPAVPRDPRPVTLSPDLFTGKVREVYRIAREVPELLEQMPCYCGCYVSDRHRNNLDCYTDRHSVG